MILWNEWTHTHTYYSYTSPFTKAVPIYPIKNKSIILIQSSYPTLSNFTLTHTPYREISKYSTLDSAKYYPPHLPHPQVHVTQDHVTN